MHAKKTEQGARANALTGPAISHDGIPLHPTPPIRLHALARGSSVTLAKEMLAQRQLPEFATATWYADPSDHRCPHDAWLEAVEVQEIAGGERKEKRRTAITLRLLGAYHDGQIVFRYSGVTKYRIGSDASDRGAGDWLHDEFVANAVGCLSHRITWCVGREEKSEWHIEAEEVTYEWIPKKG